MMPVVALVAWMTRLYWPACVGVPLRVAVAALNVIPGGTPPSPVVELAGATSENVYEPLPAGS